MNDLSTAPVIAAAEAVDPNSLVFRIPNTETDISIVLGEIPADTRLDLLKKAVRDMIANRVNVANVRNNKALEPWNAYDEASKADPLQTAVPKPEGERPSVDLLAVAAKARSDLYAGELQKRGDGSGRKAREPKDPLVAAVTKAVISELFQKKKAGNPSYKIMDAQKEVGTDGVAYLKSLIDEKVAAGADRATFEKFMEDRYMKPARIMLGIDVPKGLKDAEGLL